MKDESPARAEVLQKTLILLVLRTLGIARRIGQISEEFLQLNQGTLYPALLHMEQENWIVAKWALRKITAARSSTPSLRADCFSVTA